MILPAQDESIAIPVTVVTGFLGAGKTTLVNRWLGEVPRGQVAVIVNEFGEVGVDGALLEASARARALIEIAGGCVCCATQSELVSALDALASNASPPRRILVETSGAASPAGVIHAVSGGARRGTLSLDGVITVVDASRTDALDDQELAIEQIGYADVVVLSRADACPERVRAASREWVTNRNGAALVVEAARGELAGAGLTSLEALLDRRRADFADAREAEPKHAAHVYESISMVASGSLDGERFADFMELELGRFAGRLFRTKGILSIEGLAVRMIVQGVADQVEVTFGEPWSEGPRSSRLVVVGFGLDRDALARSFAACASSAQASRL